MKKLWSLKCFFTFCSILFLSILLNSCNTSDDSEELSGGYFYRDEGIKTKEIRNHLPNRKEIYSTVIDYNYNSDFIVAVQKPSYQEFKTAIGFNLRDNLKKYSTNSAIEQLESERQADSILHDPYYKLIFAHKINYWIIDNKYQKVFGPLTEQEYQKRRIALNVPSNIKLKESF